MFYILIINVFVKIQKFCIVFSGVFILNPRRVVRTCGQILCAQTCVSTDFCTKLRRRVAVVRFHVIRDITTTLPPSPLIPALYERNSGCSQQGRGDRIVYNDVIECLCGFAKTPQSNIVLWTSGSKHLLLLRTDTEIRTRRPIAVMRWGVRARRRTPRPE